MGHGNLWQRAALAAASLSLVAVAGCGGGTVNQPAPRESFKTQLWVGPALGYGLERPGVAPYDLALGTMLWGHPYAAGYGFPMILPQSSLWVGSGIELLIGTWPYRSILYSGV